jgi:hypothetical protein
MTWDWRGPAIVGIADRIARKALAEVAEVLLEESNRTIPWQTGDMQRSGGIAHKTDGRPQSVVHYGAGGINYAVRQHEDTRLRHPGGRRAEWLRRTLDENRRRYIAWIETSLDRGLR